MSIFSKLAIFRAKPAETVADTRITQLRSGAAEGTRLTQTPGIDTLTPVSHSLPRLDPHTTDYHTIITAKVEELTDGGSLDEATVTIVDGWIDSLRPTWEAAVRDESGQRMYVANSIIAQLRGLHADALLRLREARSTAQETGTEYSAARTKVGLPPVDMRSGTIAEPDLPSLLSETIVAGQGLAEEPVTGPPVPLRDTPRISDFPTPKAVGEDQ